MRLILERGEEAVIGGNRISITGTTTPNESITILYGNVTFDASFNAGGDTIILPGSADDYVVYRSGAVTIFEGPNGTIRIPAGSAGTEIGFSDDGGTETLVFDVSGATPVLLLGNFEITTTPQALASNSGTVIINGSSGDDIVWAEDYDGFSFFGNDGNDVLYSRGFDFDGSDIFNGGAGDDTLALTEGASVFDSQFANFTSVENVFGLGNVNSASIYLGVNAAIAGVEAVAVGDGGYSIFLMDDYYRDAVIIAGSGDDYIDAGAGDDIIDAGAGDDIIYLDGGNDAVFTGAGFDVIVYTERDIGFVSGILDFSIVNDLIAFDIYRDNDGFDGFDPFFYFGEFSSFAAGEAVLDADDGWIDFFVVREGNDAWVAVDMNDDAIIDENDIIIFLEDVDAIPISINEFAASTGLGGVSSGSAAPDMMVVSDVHIISDYPLTA